MQRQLVLLSVCTYDINNWVQGKLVFDAQCLVCGLRKFRINMPQKLISTLKIFVVLSFKKQLQEMKTKKLQFLCIPSKTRKILIFTNIKMLVKLTLYCENYKNIYLSNMSNMDGIVTKI